jgi:hypothetical protein
MEAASAMATMPAVVLQDTKGSTVRTTPMSVRQYPVKMPGIASMMVTVLEPSAALVLQVGLELFAQPMSMSAPMHRV